MDSRYQRILTLLQVPADVAVVIQLISIAVGLMAVATLWGVAAVSRFPVGPQILFYIGFGVLVATLVGTIAVVLYRLMKRRKRKAEARLIAIAQEEVRKTLTALLEELKTKLPELEVELAKLGGEIAKELEIASAPLFDALEVFLTAIFEHTHDDSGKAQFPRIKEVSDLLESASGEEDSPRGAAE